jgi:CBS domain-containing protein
MPGSKLERQLLAETVGQLDLSDFCIVTADSTVREAVKRMRTTRHNCAIIVGEHTHIVGIFTDRDVLHKVVSHPEVWDSPVKTVMTPNPHLLSVEDTAEKAIDMMRQGRYRNVPVIDGDTIVGNVTHFSILNFLSEQFASSVYNLPPDPDNFAENRVGG